MAVWPKLGLVLTAGAALVAPGAAAPSQPTAAQASHLLRRRGRGPRRVRDRSGWTTRRGADGRLGRRAKLRPVARRPPSGLSALPQRRGVRRGWSGAPRPQGGRRVPGRLVSEWLAARLLRGRSRGAPDPRRERGRHGGPDAGRRRRVVHGVRGLVGGRAKLAFTLEPSTPTRVTLTRAPTSTSPFPAPPHSELGETWYSATWSPSSHELAFRAGLQIVVADADSGATKVVANAEFPGPVWSPDGTKLLFSRGHGAGQNSLDVPTLPPARPPARLDRADRVRAGRVVLLVARREPRRLARHHAVFSTSAPTEKGETRLRRAPWIGWPPGVGPATWSPTGDALAFRRGACARFARTAPA